MLGIIGRRRLQAVDIPRVTAMRAGHGSPVFRRGTYSTQSGRLPRSKGNFVGL
jgi:hypothetical protein